MNAKKEDKIYMSSSQTAKHFGVHPNTVRKWDSNGTIKSYRIGGSLIGHRRYDISSFTGTIAGITNYTSLQPQTKESVNVVKTRGAIYCRVSSTHQKPDLERQIASLQQLYPEYELFKDVASGINFKRSGFLKLIEHAIKGNLDEIVVAHRDRLSRFAFDFIEWILQQYKVKLVVLNQTINQSKEQELAEDLLSIIHVFSCRQNGKRKYKIKPESNSKSESKSESESESESKSKSKSKDKSKRKTKNT